MYTDDDIMTPRDRISNEMLRKMLQGELSGREMVRRNAVEGELEMERNGCTGGCQGACNGDNGPQRSGGFGLKNYPLCMVYAPIQEFCNLYDPEYALRQGTIFKEMDFPFEGERIKKGGNCCG